MIEPMKQVTVICLALDRDKAIDRLGELGIVHVVDVQPPQSTEVERLVQQRDAAEKALTILRGVAKERTHEPPEGEPRCGGEVVRCALDFSERIEELAERRQQLVSARERLEPWGSYDRGLLERVEASGLQVVLCRGRKGRLPDLPEQCAVEAVSERGRQCWVAVVCTDECELPDGLEPVFLPEQTDLGAIDDEIAALDQERRDIEDDLHTLTREVSSVATTLAHLEEALAFARARSGMGREEGLSYLQGFVPADSVDKLQLAAAQNGWGTVIEDPPKDAEQVPTKITLPRWVAPIRVVFKAMGILPGYREIDISAWFMIFLAVFFAMLFGDAGYGAVFLLGTVIVRRKFPDAPAAPFRLLTIFSASTIVWGVLAGTYFGIQQDLWAPLAALKVEAFRDDVFVQKLCFLLGAVHLTIAHLWNAIVLGKSPKALSELAWISVLWGNFFLARMLVLSETPPPAMTWFYGIGIAGIVLFANPSRNPLKMIGGGIGALALGIVNSFVDVVSYIRLYAVGAATVAVAQSFNNMGGALLPSWTTFLIGAAVLLFGHALNVVLGAMSVLVHGVRLNVLEFSQHLGLQWSGTAYNPLRKGSTSRSEV